MHGFPLPLISNFQSEELAQKLSPMVTSEGKSFPLFFRIMGMNGYTHICVLVCVCRSVCLCVYSESKTQSPPLVRQAQSLSHTWSWK